MKIVLGTVAALMLSVAALSTPADAACWAGPNGWHCWHPHHDWQWRHWHHGWDHDTQRYLGAAALIASRRGQVPRPLREAVAELGTLLNTALPTGARCQWPPSKAWPPSIR